MMFTNKKVLTVLILILLFGLFGFGQESPVIDREKMKEEILAIYKSGGETGLRNFLGKNINYVEDYLIRIFSEAGVKEKNEGLLKIALIIAEEKKNEQFVATVHMNMGLYFSSLGDFEKMIEFFEKSFPTLIKIKNKSIQDTLTQLKKMIDAIKKNDSKKMVEIMERFLFLQGKSVDINSIGQLYIMKGAYYAQKEDYKKAHFMFDLALHFFEKDNDYDNQGKILNLKGIIYSQNNQYEKEEEMYDKALLFFKKSENLNEQGKIYIEKGYIYFRKMKNSEAFDMYDKALFLFKKTKNLDGQGKVYNEKGDVLRLLKKNQEALEMYNKAIPIFENTGNDYDLGNSYESKGDIYLDEFENENALDMFNKALSLFEKKRDNNIWEIGVIYGKIGEVYFSMGDNLKALEMNTKALNIFNKLEGCLRDQYRIYFQFSNIYFESGNVSLAIKMLNNALFISVKMKDPFYIGFIYSRLQLVYLTVNNIKKALEMNNKEIDNSKNGNLMDMGFSYLSRSNIYLRVNEYGKALEIITKTENILKKSRNNEAMAAFYSDVGALYFQMGDYHLSKKFYQKSQDLMPEIDKYESFLLSMGALNFKMNDFEKAKTMYENVKILGEKKNISEVVARAYVGLGDIHYINKNISQAINEYNKALTIFKKIHYFLGQADINKIIGNIYFDTGDYPKAIEMYDKALPIYKEKGAIELMSIAFQLKALALAKIGKPDMARSLFDEAIKNFEKIRYQSTFSKLKKLQMEKMYDQYVESAAFMLENNFHDKGFRYAELMKARVFLDQMAEGLKKVDKGLLPELKEKRDNLILKISTISKQMVNSEGTNKKVLEVLENQLRVAESEFEDLLVQIRIKNPKYAAVQYPEPISFKDLQKKVLKKGEILLHYFIAQEQVYVFVISEKIFNVVKLTVKKEDVDKMAKDYDDYISDILNKKTQQDLNIRRVTRLLVNHGNVFYQSLFRPIETSLKGETDIIIVPDGNLARIPFESFVIDKSNPKKPIYLLQKYRIKYIQSATALSIIRKYYRRENHLNSFVGFGDPVYDYENFKQGKKERSDIYLEKNDELEELNRDRYAREGGNYDRLLHTAEEVNTIAGLFKNKSLPCSVYLRDQATEENAKSPEMKKYGFIHIASHGASGDSYQGLILSQIPNAKEDGFFTMNEIMNCEFNARQVVLSACQTGLGKMERGEGVTGLTRAVMYAGTPAVVVSLWNVNDVATKELMVKFYTNILEKGMNLEEALRQAKLELIHSEKFSSPYFWSPFIMYGE